MSDLTLTLVQMSTCARLEAHLGASAANLIPANDEVAKHDERLHIE